MYYRCYVKDRHGIPKVHAFDAESDEDALQAAERMLSSAGHTVDVFEVWQQNRLVVKRERSVHTSTA